MFSDVHTTNTDNNVLQLSPQSSDYKCDPNHVLQLSPEASDYKYEPKLSAIADTPGGNPVGKQSKYCHTMPIVYITRKAVGVNVTSNVRNNGMSMSTRTMTDDICCQEERLAKDEHQKSFSNAVMLQETKLASEHECLPVKRTSKIDSCSSLHPKRELMGKRRVRQPAISKWRRSQYTFALKFILK
ncbi:hypothetical protein Tco_0672109 [Tanacetum coccineum]